MDLPMYRIMLSFLMLCVVLSPSQAALTYLQVAPNSTTVGSNVDRATFLTNVTIRTYPLPVGRWVPPTSLTLELEVADCGILQTQPQNLTRARIIPICSLGYFKDYPFYEEAVEAAVAWGAGALGVTVFRGRPGKASLLTNGFQAYIPQLPVIELAVPPPDTPAEENTTPYANDIIRLDFSEGSYLERIRRSPGWIFYDSVYILFCVVVTLLLLMSFSVRLLSYLNMRTSTRADAHARSARNAHYILFSTGFALVASILRVIHGIDAYGQGPYYPITIYRFVLTAPIPLTLTAVFIDAVLQHAIARAVKRMNSHGTRTIINGFIVGYVIVAAALETVTEIGSESFGQAIEAWPLISLALYMLSNAFNVGFSGWSFFRFYFHLRKSSHTDVVWRAIWMSVIRGTASLIWFLFLALHISWIPSIPNDDMYVAAINYVGMTGIWMVQIMAATIIFSHPWPTVITFSISSTDSTGGLPTAARPSSNSPVPKGDSSNFTPSSTRSTIPLYSVSPTEEEDEETHSSVSTVS